MSANYLGTYKGVVLRTNDPQNSGRIILQIPQILGSAESAWASPAKPTTEIPKIGDIVYVTFDGGDISYPVYAPAGTGGTQIPKQPTALTLSTTSYSTPEGIALAQVTASWIVPTENQDGSAPVDLAGFTAEYSFDNTTWSGGAFTLDATITFAGITGGSTVYIRVASMSHANRPSLFATANIATSSVAPPAGSTLGIQSAAIVNLQDDLLAAVGLADGKAVIWVQNTAPTGLVAADKGDIWINTSTADRITKVWDGAAWQDVTDQKTLDVLATVNTKITTFYAPSTATPSATAVGDLWIVTDDSNRLKRAVAVGTADWVYVDDTRIAAVITVANSALATANGKNTVTWSVNAPVAEPNTAGDLWFRYTTGEVIIGQWIGAGGTNWLSSTMRDEVFASISVGKLITGSLGVGVRVIAGPENDAHAEMTNTGFVAFTKDSAGNVREAVRMGSGSDAVFTVPDANGDPLAAIEKDGQGSFAKLASKADPVVSGFPLFGNFLQHTAVPSSGAIVDGWMDMLPRGVVAFGTIGAVAYSGTNVSRRELAFKVEPGRSYKVSCSGGLVTFPVAQTPAGFYLSVATPTAAGGNATGVGGGAVIYSYNHVNTANNMASLGSVFRILRANKDGKGVGGELNYGWNRVFFHTNGSITPNDPIDIIVEDIGPDIPDTDVANATATGTAGAITVTTTTYNADGWATYAGTGTPLRGSSAAIGDTNSKIYQGTNRDRDLVALDGYGDQRGLWTFPTTLASDLTGATISKIEVFLDAVYWFLPTGTAYIGVHGYTLNTWPTAALPSLVAAVSVPGWPKPGGQWVTLPTGLYSGFAAGTYRGVSIGPIGAMANSFGYFDTAAQIRATYTK